MGMPQTRESTAYAQRLIKEYNHTRKLLRKYLKKSHDPSDVTAMIKVVIDNMTAKQSKIIGYTLNSAFKAGAKEGDKILRKTRVTASTATVGFDLTQVSETHLGKITKSTIGHVGKYNSLLTKQLRLEYNALLADNKLVNSLAKTGWTLSIEKALTKRGISAEVLTVMKGQTTTKKIVSVLETNGIRGGMNPRQVSRLLQPSVSAFFGPEGVLINNVGKFKKVLKVDADGNYKYVKQAVTRPYRATPRTYSNLLARSSMLSAHNEGRYQSLQASKLVDYYISVSVLDANTCNLCATMHGQRVSHSEGPLYHPSCACELKPIWKKDSGIKNKDPGVYDKQRDQHFWKQHQLAEYNKNMPRGAKLKFHSMLPGDALTDMPGKEAMRTIRYDMLGKPIAIKPKVPVKTPKAATKAKTIETMNDKEIANELWEKTAIDGKEHAIIRNGLPHILGGQKNSVNVKAADIPTSSYEFHHSHPVEVGFSGNDISAFLSQHNMNTMTATTATKIHKIVKTPGTKKLSNTMINDFNREYRAEVKGAFEPMAKIEGRSKELWDESIQAITKRTAKWFDFTYEVIPR